MRLNLAMLPLDSLHVLHQGVTDELNIREQRTLTAVSEFKVNNHQLFVEKTQTLKEQVEFWTQRQNLVTMIEQASKSILELGIPDDADTSTKVRKLVVVVRASKKKVDKVTFDLQMQIDELLEVAADHTSRGSGSKRCGA